MDRQRLEGVIASKNERLEEQALQSAEYYINNIANAKHQIKSLEEGITEYQKQLRELTVEQLDATEVLGGTE